MIFCPAFTVGKHILTSTEDCEDAIDDDKEDVNHENDCDDLEDHDHDDDHHIDDDDNEYCDVDDDLGDNEYCDVDDDDYPDVDDVEIFGNFPGLQHHLCQTIKLVYDVINIHMMTMSTMVMPMMQYIIQTFYSK